MTAKNTKKMFHHVLKGMELLENRCLLSASPIDVGTVYYEGAGTEVYSGEDSAPDYIYVAFQGGAEGTEMTQVTIDMARWDDGSYCFIDQGQGVYGYSPFEILPSDDYEVLGYKISSDSTQLTIDLKGFTAGDVLIISCDVDQVITAGLNSKTVAVAEAGEYELSSTFKAKFEHANYYTLNIEDELGYVDVFSTIPNYVEIAGLPDEGYLNEYSVGRNGKNQEVYTAAAFASDLQVELPCTLSGNVWEDMTATGTQYRAGIDEYIEDVEIRLYQLNEYTGKYEWVQTDYTDENGHYSFDVEAGTYRVLEIQPNGYRDVTSFVGTIDGWPVGTQISVNELSDITIFGGEDSIQNNFSEYRPCEISGIVWFDVNKNDQYDSWIDELLEGVQIDLENEYGMVIATAYTDKDGYYEFTELLPGEYQIYEHQPIEFEDGGERVGTVDGVKRGVVLGNDYLGDICLFSNDVGIHYDFWEVEYERCSISGYVFKDGPDLVLKEGDKLPANLWELYPGIRSADDTMLAGITLILQDSNGNEVARTTTNANGYYEFLDLTPGQYQIFEVHPTQFKDGIDTPGDLGGTPLMPDGDKLYNIELNWGDHGVEYNFSEIKVVWEKKPEPGGNITPITPPAPVYHSGGGSAPVIGNSYMPNFGNSTGLSLGGSGGGGAAFHLAVLGSGSSASLAAAAGAAGAAGIMGNAAGNAASSILADANGNVNAYANADAFANANASALAAQANAAAYANYLHIGNLDLTSFDPNSWEGRALIRVRQMLAEGLDPSRVWTTEELRSARLLAGDFNGDGVDEFAIFTDGFWFIDLNGNRQWDDYDLWVKLGERGDQPIVGDWNGDGKADVGVFGTPWDGDRELVIHEYGLPDAENQLIGTYKNIPTENKGHYYVKAHRDGILRREVVDHVFQFGKPGDIAVAGDWNGDGVASVGVYNNGKWTLDYDGDGRFTSADKEFVFGEPGDIPVVGKWDHSEVSKVGVYRRGEFVLDVEGKGVMDSSVAHVHHHVPNGRPVVGDFTGSGVADIAANLPQNAGSGVMAAQPGPSSTH